ncbi:hypothetical protein B484DRAFT_332400 [Ochromonadaceae sp. CCMP2298]|nr:hypothetical protein B484DRAFT_332400 [Ochromonadaceae sp. CCMP2298]
MATQRSEQFAEVCSQDFLRFQFGGRSYQDQLNDSIAKTEVLAGVKVERISVPVDIAGQTVLQELVWVTHNFGFLGGSLGCAEGEKITRAFELAAQEGLPVCVQCRSGGARMQEGTSSLMQMAKVSVAVQSLGQKGLPFISVLNDPTFGGVSASYAMQADVRIASFAQPRIGFAGPAVILNTMCEGNQSRFDDQCPNDFQSAELVRDCGQIDTVLRAAGGQADVERYVALVAQLLCSNRVQDSVEGAVAGAGESIDYTRSRRIDRPQTQDFLQALLGNFTELSGDGKVGRDRCLRGGVGLFHGVACVGLGTYKGHTPTDMQNANYGMPSPHGYRTALRLMQLAEKFSLPVITLVDTVGAWPTFGCEVDGQSEAIATNLTLMAGLKVPIVTVLVGEGGSGGALGICMGNCIGMLSGGYFGVISPEGAASILGRYSSEAHKADQFPRDCMELATAQRIYAHQLQELGVVDDVIYEGSGEKDETYQSFPVLRARVDCFLLQSLLKLAPLSAEQLVQQRYDKYRRLGSFQELDDSLRQAAVDSAKQASSKKKPLPRAAPVPPSLLLQHLAGEIVLGDSSRYRKLAPANGLGPAAAPGAVAVVPGGDPMGWVSAKAVLEAKGAAFLCQQWMPAQTRVLVTDTTMRDAHQSLLATRVRTIDLVKGAEIAAQVLERAFSLEAWGGATFDVAMRFLDEDPWERLRALRKACPNVMLQMLIRGANAVGYTSYADNVVQEFVRLAAVNGMDVFRIFDCWNELDNMLVCIEAVLKSGKVAEVCVCYTGNCLESAIYSTAYYAELAGRIKGSGAHILGIKDMAGLMRPREVQPLMQAIRQAVGPDMPIHFHTHATSSGSLAICLEMARAGCNVIDFATASMADGTSQPSLNTFLAMMEGEERDPKIPFMTLEPYDTYWGEVRELYSPFESGMKSGTARVFDHQIPGGQYSNLLVQCGAMGLRGDQWSAVLDAYRDVNMLFGDVVKVTPSSKCVGDLALYLVLKNLTTADLIDPVTGIAVPEAALLDFPESVVGLMKGDLGFPHRGFPPALVSLVLKGNMGLQRKERAGLQLAPVDFAQNIATLSEQWGTPIAPEQAMSSLMYPAVWAEYMGRLAKQGPLRCRLPTDVFWYGALPGDSFSLCLSPQELPHLLTGAEAKAASEAGAEAFLVRAEVLRVGPVQQGQRTVVFKVRAQSQAASGQRGSVFEETQQLQVKDSGGVFVFQGPMVDASKPLQLGSPMAGLVDKVFVAPGQKVVAGEVLCVVSAMKMEVNVSAPCDGVVAAVAIPAVGYRVVEGALLVTLKQ